MLSGLILCWSYIGNRSCSEFLSVAMLCFQKTLPHWGPLWPLALIIFLSLPIKSWGKGSVVRRFRHESLKFRTNYEYVVRPCFKYSDLSLVTLWNSHLEAQEQAGREVWRSWSHSENVLKYVQESIDQQRKGTNELKRSGCVYSR